MRNMEGDGEAVKEGLPRLGAEFAATRWPFEQHLSPRKPSRAELFAPHAVGVPA